MPVSFKEKSNQLALQLQRSGDRWSFLCFFLRLLLLSASLEKDVLKLKSGDYDDNNREAPWFEFCLESQLVAHKKRSSQGQLVPVNQQRLAASLLLGGSSLTCKWVKPWSLFFHTLDKYWHSVPLVLTFAKGFVFIICFSSGSKVGLERVQKGVLKCSGNGDISGLSV